MEVNDIVAIGTAVSQLLSPYIEIFARKAVVEIGSEVPELIKQIWNSIYEKMSGKESSKEALEEIQREPKDNIAQMNFNAQLTKAFRDDDAFLGSIASLLSQLRTQDTKNKAISINGDNNNVADSGSILVNGNVKGNVSINSSPKNDLEI